MIEKWADFEIEEEDTMEQVQSKIQAKLGIEISYLAERLSSYVQENAATLIEDFPNIAPFGDYSKLIENPKEMIQFLMSEAHKPEHWKLQVVRVNDLSPTLLTFEFGNKAIDDGDTCSGFAYVNFAGKLKHFFVQGDV
jgi:hypothetical protein